MFHAHFIRTVSVFSMVSYLLAMTFPSDSNTIRLDIAYLSCNQLLTLSSCFQKQFCPSIGMFNCISNMIPEGVMNMNM